MFFYVFVQILQYFAEDVHFYQLACSDRNFILTNLISFSL